MTFVLLWDNLYKDEMRWSGNRQKSLEGLPAPITPFEEVQKSNEHLAGLAGSLQVGFWHYEWKPPRFLVRSRNSKNCSKSGGGISYQFRYSVFQESEIKVTRYGYRINCLLTKCHSIFINVRG